MRLIDGRGIAASIRAETRERAARLGFVPRLGVVTGGAGAAGSYVRALLRAGRDAGVEVVVGDFRDEVHGILVLTREAARLPAAKDVDGMSPLSPYVPATADAVMEILARSGVAVRGAHAVVIGSGAVAGRPIALHLLAADATVTVCHEATRDVAAIARGADVLVSAAGHPRLVTRRFVKPGAVIVDVGVSVVGDGVVGDVDADDVRDVAGALTPTPGGVGPVTTAILLRNTVDASELVAQDLAEGVAR